MVEPSELAHLAPTAAWPRTCSWSTGSPRTTEHLTAPLWRSRRLTASAGVRSPFAISRYSLIFFFFSLLLETRSTQPAATAARPHALHPAPPSHSLHAHLLSPPSDRRSRLDEAWPRRRLGRPHPLPHVGGCSGHLLKVVNLSWYGRVHSAHAWPPVEPTIKASLPIAFDTPMFWSSEDLEQLRGTAVLGRSPYSNSPPRVLMLRCRQDRERAGRERLLGQSRSVT